MILALVFLISVSLIVIALLGWVGTSLTATTHFSDERATETAVTSAINLAIQNTRYTFTSAMVNASPPVQCWGSTSQSAPASNLSVDGESVDVWCSMVWQPFSQTAQTRIISYSACLDSTPNNPSPTAAGCAANPVLQAEVAFDDLPGGPAVVPNDHPVPCTTPPNGYCGQSMTQESWQWNPDVPTVTSISVTSAPSNGLNNGSPMTMQVNGNGFVPGAKVNFVQETGSNPGPGVVPPVANVPTTPAGQEQGVIVPATVTPNSVSCSGPGNTNCSLQITVPAVPVTSPAPPPSLPSGPDYFVTVTTPGGTSPYQPTPTSPFIHFGYTPFAPTVTSIGGTTSGAITGGSLITLTGTGFYSVPNFAAQVVFCSASPCVTTGSNPTGWLATDVTITSSTTLTAVSPAVSTTGITYPDAFFIQVNTVGGSTSNTNVNFTYSVQVPIIFSISPTTGTTSTLVTINGYNFLSGSTVAWIQVSATDQNATPNDNAVSSQTSTNYVNNTQLTVTVPSNLPNPNGNGNGTTTYVPMVINPGNTGIYSQPYNESADEFIFP